MSELLDIFEAHRLPSMNVFERAKEYQAVLNEMRMSADDRTTLQDELNAEWNILIKRLLSPGRRLYGAIRRSL
jgi:hypothetical protein